HSARGRKGGGQRRSPWRRAPRLQRRRSADPRSIDRTSISGRVVVDDPPSIRSPRPHQREPPRLLVLPPTGKPEPARGQRVILAQCACLDALEAERLLRTPAAPVAFGESLPDVLPPAARPL